MNRHLANRMLRISIDATTYPATYRERRLTRKERKATARVLLLTAFALAYFGARAWL